MLLKRNKRENQGLIGANSLCNIKIVFTLFEKLLSELIKAFGLYINFYNALQLFFDIFSYDFCSKNKNKRTKVSRGVTKSNIVFIGTFEVPSVSLSLLVVDRRLWQKLQQARELAI